MLGKKLRKITGMMLLAALMFVLPVMVEAADRGYAGVELALARYHEDVAAGREPIEVKSSEEILDEAKQAALDTYDHLGIVDIGSGYLNVRATASEDGEVIGKMLDGYAGEILEKKGDWYHISSGDVDGYVSTEYMLKGKKAKKKALKVMELRVQITTETLNVRTEPSIDSEMWTQVNELERYPVVGDLGDWIEIELDTSTGYVDSDYVEVRYCLNKAVEFHEAPEETLRNSIVDYAMQFLGGPYVWGGESLTNGCDCSGFTMLIYRHFGYSLTHYSGSQANEGKRITSAEMQPGDLIFYTDRYGTINHVTMYIGNGKCIGAQSSRAGIDIRSWDYRTPVRIVSVLG